MFYEVVLKVFSILKPKLKGCIMRNLYSFILVFLFSAFLPVSVSSQDVSGTISGNVTWGPGSVNVVGDVSVTGNLTIAAGTTVSASDQVMITVTSTGTITAQGIEGNEILFTAANPSTGWEGIYFDGGTGDESSSVFEYCVFEYGNRTSGGAVNMDYHSNVSFNYCTFQFNEVNTLGAAINAFHSKLAVSHCVFKNNIATEYGGGGAIRAGSGGGNEMIIENSSFYNNSAYTGGALMLEGSDGIIVSGCIFANNEANFGGAITISQANNDISFYANTFANNKTLNSDATIRVAAIQGFNFINNIVSGFDADNAIEFDGAYADNLAFENCLIDGGLSSVMGLPASYVWTDMVDGAASFVAPSSASGLAGDGSSADWQLSDQSLAINAGKEDVSGLNFGTFDLAGNTRVQQGRIDIGALESSFVPTAVFNPATDEAFDVFLRRDENKILVKADNSFVRFSGVLFDISGAIVADKRSVLQQQQMTFETTGLRKGIYVVKVLSESGKVLEISKIIIN